ncbi:MAG: hypothetical protein P8Z74_13110, partial [Acidobacteriota bacterium]
YNLGSGWQNRPANGVVANVPTRSIQLDGSGSVGVGTKTYGWSVSPTSAGSVTPSNSANPTLQVNEGVTQITASLTVTDTNGQSTQSITFQVQASAGSLTPQISYDLGDGSGFVGSLTNGQTGPQITRAAVKFKGSVTGATGSPTYTWAFSRDGLTVTPTSTSGDQAELNLAPGTATLTVTLEVADGDQNGNLAVTFPLQIVEPPEVTIDLQQALPVSVRVGETFFADGTATSQGGSGKFNFTWATDPENSDSPTMWRNDASTPTSTSARIVAPPLTTEDLSPGTFTLTLTAEEEGGQTATDERTITLLPTSLDFSQVAAGNFKAPGVCDNCKIETVVVLVNPAPDAATTTSDSTGGDTSPQQDGEPAAASTPAHCRIDFNEGGAAASTNPTIDGDGSVDGQGRYVFQIPKGQSREFTVQSDSLWVGWASVESTQPLVGHLFYRYVDPEGKVKAEIPVLPIRGTSFTTALTKAGAEHVGLAIANLSADDGGEVELEVIVERNSGGKLSSDPITLGPQSQFVKNLTEIYGADLLRAFLSGTSGGTLRVRTISGSGGPLALTVIKLDDDSLPLAILPVSVGTEASR